MRKNLALLICLFVAAAFAFSSCEKEVKINLTNGQSQLVVNGQIELGRPPFVVLTNSIGYFTTVDLTTLENSFVHNADVQINNGIKSVKLREYTVDTGGTAKFSFYSVDTADPNAFNFVGESEKFYSLRVTTADGKTYTSTTKIPAPYPIDSLTATAPKKQSSKAPTAMQLMVYYTDPDTPGNAVRCFTQRNRQPFYPCPNSVFDDEVVNGTHVQFPLQAGSADNNITFNDSTGFVFRGDTVTLKWCTIDRGVFNFYQTYEYSIGTVGNPFSSPINVMTNISGGALGIWAGYGVSYYTIVVPK